MTPDRERASVLLLQRIFGFLTFVPCLWLAALFIIIGSLFAWCRLGFNFGVGIWSDLDGHK